MGNGKSEKIFIFIALLIALAMAALISPFASSSPDGLEKMAERLGFLHRAEGKSMWEHSPMPDYAVPGVEKESSATGLAGVIGTLAVFGITFALGWSVLRLRHRRNQRLEEQRARPSH